MKVQEPSPSITAVVPNPQPTASDQAERPYVLKKYQHMVGYNRQKPEDAILQDLMHKASGVIAEIHPGQTLPQSNMLYEIAETYARGINKNKEIVDKMSADDTIEISHADRQYYLAN
jgi:hypothetical protein